MNGTEERLQDNQTNAKEDILNQFWMLERVFVSL